MAWVSLTIAGIFEWGRPVGLELGLTDRGCSGRGFSGIM